MSHSQSKFLTHALACKKNLPGTACSLLACILLIGRLADLLGIGSRELL